MYDFMIHYCHNVQDNIGSLLNAAFPVSSTSVLFSEHAQWVCVWGWGWGSRFQGDENTRIQAAAAVLCNRAVTSMMYKRLVER